MQRPLFLQRWIEVDLDAIEANALEVRRRLPLGCALMAVLKADAYGFGAPETAQALAACADMLAVTTLEEGLELRISGITAPALVLSAAFAEEMPFYARHKLMPSIDNEVALRALNGQPGGPHPFHLALETGMNRLGCLPEEGLALAALARELEGVELSGVYSHLATAAGKNKRAALRQKEIFSQFLRRLKERGIPYGLAHLANSAALLTLPDCSFDMVRVGTLLFGRAPCPLPSGWRLKDPWSCKAKIIKTHMLKKGEAIGYGAEFRAKKDMPTGVVAIGYADGFALEPQTRPQSLAHAFRRFVQETARRLLRRPQHYLVYKNRKLPIIGRISMHLTAVDLRGSGAACGDVVEAALRCASASSRLCRLFLRGGEVTAMRGVISETRGQEV
ncbi:MAG: alanine racemase [Clostridiales bacterium]|nr:alanine racemase [Clostridiales bacterium]